MPPINEWPLWAVYLALYASTGLVLVALWLLLRATVLSILGLGAFSIVCIVLDFGVGLLAVVFGLIPAAIAHRKGRNFFAWWLCGTLLWIVATPHAIVTEERIRMAR